MTDSQFNGILFVLFGLIPLVIFGRLFILVTIAWVGAIFGYFFYYTRWIWLFIAYVLGNIWLLSAKMVAVGIPIVGISYAFGFTAPFHYIVGALLHVFIFWPIWAVTHFTALF